ncbi:HNH endonuclease signature motif containing protein, partial [Mycobacterium sp. NPDC004974]
GGNTNVDDMALACGPDNRLVHTNGGYTTTINNHGEVEWHPPPQLDHGQHRINYHHRPELLLTPPQDQPEPEPQQHPEHDPERDLTHEPEQPADGELQWHPQWDLDWDNDFDQPTPNTPNVEHLWNPEPSAPEPLDPRLPPGWTLLNNNHALSGKAVRGP